MFTKIFAFEISYKLKRPAVYIYFLICFVFTFLAFANGAMPLDEKQWVNGSASLEFFISMMSMMMMLVSSSVMGVPLYRDIEYNTKEYYLSYPITKNGYFWGRYLSSFLFVVLINAAVLPAAWLGGKAGVALGWIEASAFGPDVISRYLYPFLVLALPNLFFTASLFFGLVAITRNVKVIYSSGILLLLGYMIANFFISNSSSKAIIYLSDPFGINPVRMEKGLRSIAGKNVDFAPLDGWYLANRLLWSGIGLVMLAYTYLTFSFDKFFSGRPDKRKLKQETATNGKIPLVNVSYKKPYTRMTLLTLTRLEVLNIIRDNYFWIIVSGGAIFLGIVFSNGPGSYWVRMYPLTNIILFIFNDAFQIFIFCIIAFYTGETIHREKVTRYSLINDALPPADWLLALAKLFSMFLLALFITLMPMLIGIIAQLGQGYTHFNIPLYFEVLLGATLPKCIEMAMLAFALHILINNKFAALGVAISLWTLFIIADKSGWFNYHLLLYGFTPFYSISEMDGIGHMFKAITWFNIYWLLFGILLVFLGYLFYVRGINATWKERLLVAGKRLRPYTLPAMMTVGVLFVIVAAYCYYNVSELNVYFTDSEQEEHAAILEKSMKQYETLPQPDVTAMKIQADLYPEKQMAAFHSFVHVSNNTSKPIARLLIDADNITDMTFKWQGKVLPYTSPVLFPKAKFRLFGSPVDTAAYRFYQLPSPLLPGDSAVIELYSSKTYKGFQNSIYGMDLLRNGITIGPGLPGLGYDDGEELGREDIRRKYGLAKREDEFADEKEGEGSKRVLTGMKAPVPVDITIGTSGDQIALAPGELSKQWVENGRNYFQYVTPQPGIYKSIGLLSARYTQLKDSVILDNGRIIQIEFDCHKQHDANLKRLLNTYKDGIRFYSRLFGPLPLKQMRLAECTMAGPQTINAPGLLGFNERNQWNDHYRDSNGIDQAYLVLGVELARQWWGHQVPASHTQGAHLITDAIPEYLSLLMFEKKYGKTKLQGVLQSDQNDYLWRKNPSWQRPVAKSTSWNEYTKKAALVLYGLKELAGEDSINLALKELHDNFAYRSSPPYAGSRDLFDVLKKHLPASLHQYFEDGFNRICFYDNAITQATVEPMDNGRRFKIRLTLSAAKFYEDNNGKVSTAQNMNDAVDIGVFGNHGKENKDDTHPLLATKRVKLISGSQTLEIEVDQKPDTVELDPFFLLIDRNRGDNIKKLY